MLSAVLIVMGMVSADGFADNMPAAEAMPLPWETHGKLTVHEGSRLIEYEDGSPFLWLGCTSWGMLERLSREDVGIYLDDRKAKGMNVVQLSLFWGKRKDYPTRFSTNAANYYGHKAFLEKKGVPDALLPALVKGGTADAPNDYWDHVDFCLRAIKQRGMYAAVLPFWGRRYVNGVHRGQSDQVFTEDNIKQYGEFLGRRYGGEPHLIWLNGGDVNADDGGKFSRLYRMFAEGVARGITGEDVQWNERHAAWDAFLMSYHPDGAPLVNSSQWFHDDAWLDFNMIQTHVDRGSIPTAVRQDVLLQPVKPTVLGEGHYEGAMYGRKIGALQVRRQLYQTFFSGGAGFTYGGGFDEKGHGPLFAASNNWKSLLGMEGSGQLIHARKMLTEHEWQYWQPADELILEGKGSGELEKIAVMSIDGYLVYFPDNSSCQLRLKEVAAVYWFNPATGERQQGSIAVDSRYRPPAAWQDAVLIFRQN